MPENVWTYVFVTLIAALIWLFAEAESLGSFSGEPAQIRLVANEGADRSVRMADGSTRLSVQVDVRAPQSSIGRIRSVLSNGISLYPGMTGVPSSAGTHEIDLEQALGGDRELGAKGIDILSVRPRTIEIEIVDYETRDIPVDAQIGGVDVAGTIDVSPAKVPLRLPTTIWDSTGAGLSLIASPDLSELDQLPQSGPAQLDVAVSLPPELMDLPGVAAPSQRVMLSFTIQNRNESAEFRAVPSQVIVPPIEFGKWEVTMHPDDEFVSATASGPAAEMQLLQAADSALIAVFSLSSEELESATTSKSIIFLRKQGDDLLPLPESIIITADKTVVRFTVERRGQ